MAKPTQIEIVYSIKDQLTAAGYTDDSLQDEELIGHILNNVRLVLLKDYYKEFKTIPPTFYQEQCCLDVVCKKVECDGVWSGDKELIVEIPPVVSLGDNEIIYFGLSDKMSPFKYIPFQNLPFASHDKFNKKATAYTLVGTTTYIKNPPTQGLKYACMIALFEVPVEGCNPTEPGTWEYPLPGILIHKAELLVIQQLLSTRQPEDIQNDARDGQLNTSSRKQSDS